MRAPLAGTRAHAFLGATAGPGDVMQKFSRGPHIAALLVALASSAQASGNPAPRADEHAPIGVMGDHVHEAGEVMLSYRFGRMSMDDNYDGFDRESARSVVGTPAAPGPFTVVPTQMTMDMHMLGAMFAPHDAVTLMAMVPLVRLEMDHLTRAGGRFTTEASGLGDVRVSALIRLFDTGRHGVHLNAGLSTPTGSINESDFLPAAGSSQTLPYPMQLGSGTWDLLPGATYKGRSERISWGAQALGTIRTGDNRKSYRLGNRVDLSAWTAYRWRRWISTSARLAWSQWGNIHGADRRLNPAVVPTADPDRRAGSRLDWLLGVNLVVPLGRAGHHRFGLEYGRPIYQRLDGPQLGSQWRLVLGWQSAFEWTLPGFAD